MAGVQIALQWMAWASAVVFFLLMIWISGTFFQVQDSGAIRGKRLMALLAGGSAAYASWNLFPSTGTPIAQTLPALILYMYAIWMLIWAWRTSQARPLNFVFSHQLPQHLTRAGPYAHVRHPFYSAYCAAWSGTAVLSNDWVLRALCLALILTYIRAAIREEHGFLATPLKEAYIHYRANTRMLVPFITTPRTSNFGREN